MARYELLLKGSVSKDLRGIPRADVRRIVRLIDALRDDPRPPGCERLTGHALYRVRTGRYRVVYSVDDSRVVVEVIRVAHRREAYR